MPFVRDSNTRRELCWELIAIDHFSDYLAAWDELNADGPQSPLLSVDFILPIIMRFARPTDLLAICRVEAKPIAMGVFGPVGVGRWSTLNPVLDPFQPPVAPLGLWVANKDLEITEVLPRLLKELPGFPVVLSVMNQDVRLTCRPNDSRMFNTIDHIDTPTICTGDSFLDYWKTRKKHFKHDLRRRRNNLLKSGIAPQLRVIDSPTTAEKVFEDFCQIENAGWKGRSAVSLECNRDIKHCYHEMWRNFSQNGNARAYQYFYDDRLVAIDLCLKRYQTLSVLKTTYDEMEAASGPASLMREEQLLHIANHDSEIRRIEFYGPFMDWQRRWATEVRTMFHVNCYRFKFLRAFKEGILDVARRREPWVRAADDWNGK